MEGEIKYGPEGYKKGVTSQTVGTEATVIDINLDFVVIKWKFCRSVCFICLLISSIPLT